MILDLNCQHALVHLSAIGNRALKINMIPSDSMIGDNIGGEIVLHGDKKRKIESGASQHADMVMTNMGDSEVVLLVNILKF